MDPVQEVLKVIVQWVNAAGGRFYITRCKTCDTLGAKREGERLACFMCGKPMRSVVLIQPYMKKGRL
jgi:hypothetical protein